MSTTTQPSLTDLLFHGDLEPLPDVITRVTGKTFSRETTWKWRIHEDPPLPAVFVNGWLTSEAALKAWLLARSEALLAKQAAKRLAPADDETLRSAGLLDPDATEREIARSSPPRSRRRRHADE